MKLSAKAIYKSCYEIIFIILLFLMTISPMIVGLGTFNSVYIWLFFLSVIDPGKINFLLLGIISVFQDSYYPNALGVNGMLYATIIKIVTSQRQQIINNNFIVTWLIFSIITIFISFNKFIILSLLDDMLFCNYNFFTEISVPILMFPLVFQICTLIYKKIAMYHE